MYVCIVAHIIMERNELDFNAGSGSLSQTDVFSDTNSINESDGRSQMKTSFDQDYDGDVLMSDGERRPWWYLYKYNQGHYDSEDKEVRRQTKFRRDAATWSSHVDLSPHQKRRVLFHVDDLDINEFGQTSTEEVIVALIAFIANKDNRWIQREKEYQNLLNSLNISSDKVKKVSRRLRDLVE